MKKVGTGSPMNKNSIDLPSRCPNCGKTLLTTTKVVVSDWPYEHADIQRKCPECNWRGIHGVPMNHVDGTELLVYDVDVNRAEAFAHDMDSKVCDLCDTLMNKVKVMKVGDNDELFLQYKCPNCYLVRGEKYG